MFKKQWPAFLLAFVLPLLGVFWWWGGFATVDISGVEAGPYRYAYLEYDGPLNNMRKTQRRALDEFNAARVPAGDTITVLFTDPRTDNGKVRAHVGYLLGETASVPNGLKEGRIARRAVTRAQVRAVVLLAPSKAYQALAAYLDAQRRAIVMPAVELYRPGGEAERIGTFTVEINR
ncbi:MAG: hypothetical protein ACK4R8_08200 [Thiobacillus sp.]